MPNEWLLNVVVQTFKEKEGVRNHNTYKRAELLEYATKIIERVLKRRIRQVVNIDSMQFGFVPGRRTIVAFLV